MSEIYRKDPRFLQSYARKVQDHIDLAVIAFDQKLKIVSWNRKASELFGREASEAIGRHVSDLVSIPHQLALDLRMLQSILKGEHIAQRISLRKGLGDHWFTAEVQSFADRDAKGVIVGGTLIVQDISEAVLFSKIIEETEKVAKITSWSYLPLTNEFRFIGSQPEDFPATKEHPLNLLEFADLFELSSKSAIIEALNQDFLKKDENEIRITTQRGGKKRWFLMRWKTEHITAKATRAYGILADITTHVEQEQTIESQNQQIVATNRLAAFGELAAGVAHEINNPLAIVKGLLEILSVKLEEKKLKEEDFERLLPKITHANDRIEGIVRSLLSFSQQKFASEKTREDLNELVSQAIEFFKTKQDTLNITITFKQNPEPVFATVTKRDINQLVINVLSNAYDQFKLHQTVSPEIIVEVLKLNEGIIQIRMSNNGPKINPEVAEKVFEPFFTTKELGKGNGLGLSLCYGIARSHQGSITIDSHSPLTTFVLTLPETEQAMKLAS